MKNYLQRAVSMGKVSTAALVVALFSTSASADNLTAINDAVTAGSGLVSATTAGVIAIAALCFGLGLVVSWLRK